MYDSRYYAALIGASVSAVLISEDRLIFQTDRGLVGYRVEGDCCSTSYFYDFYGVRHLLSNGPVTRFERVDLGPGDPGWHDCATHGDIRWGEGNDWHESRQVYGYRITTEHPRFGPVTSAFSFRNDSNGYYGGWMDLFEVDTIPAGMLSLTDDIAEVPR